MKTVIVILGGSGSGKTTLGLALGGGTEKGVQTDSKLTIRGKVEKTSQSVFPNGFAIAGNLGRGSDHISSMEARHETIQTLLKNPKVNVVIVNSLRASRIWDIDAMRALKANLLYVYLNISLEENLRRITKRREANEAEPLSDKTLANIKAFHQRAAMVADTAKRAGLPCIELKDADKVPTAVKLVMSRLK